MTLILFSHTPALIHTHPHAHGLGLARLALGRDHAVRHALGSSTHSVSEDGFAGIKVTVYTDRPHASLLKAAAIVGIGRANVVDLGKPVAGTDTIGIDLGELEGYIGDAGPGSGRAVVVSLSFGEVNTVRAGYFDVKRDVLHRS